VLFICPVGVGIDQKRVAVAVVARIILPVIPSLFHLLHAIDRLDEQTPAVLPLGGLIRRDEFFSQGVIVHSHPGLGGRCEIDLSPDENGDDERDRGGGDDAPLAPAAFFV